MPLHAASLPNAHMNHRTSSLKSVDRSNYFKPPQLWNEIQQTRYDQIDGSLEDLTMLLSVSEVSLSVLNYGGLKKN